MNVFLGIVWWVKLDDPVYFGDIQTTSSNISTQ
jgi:hypothetical protein